MTRAGLWKHQKTCMPLTPKNDNEYDNIVIQCIGGVDDNKQKKDHTIIKNIASKVTIPK